jgi:hypothetical protein
MSHRVRVSARGDVVPVLEQAFEESGCFLSTGGLLGNEEREILGNRLRL